MDPNSFKEDLGSICHCDILLTSCEDGHLRKLINDPKYAIISLLGGRNARNLTHSNGFPRLLRSRKRYF
jgi:hypothetical protein